MRRQLVGMRRRVLGAIASTATIGGLVVFGAPAASALDTSCPAPGTTSGSVIVKAGETCRLDNNTVYGNVTVKPGGTFGATHTLITGSVLANGAIGENYLCASIVDGNVVVRNLPPSPDSFPPPPGNGNGPAPANDFLINAVLAFPPLGTRDCQFPVNHQIIRGSVQFINNASFVSLTGSDVGGSVTARNNTGNFYFSAGLLIDNNVNGNIICSGNSVPGFDYPGFRPVNAGGYFRGRGVGQCSFAESYPNPIEIPGQPGPQT